MIGRGRGKVVASRMTTGGMGRVLFSTPHAMSSMVLFPPVKNNWAKEKAVVEKKVAMVTSSHVKHHIMRNTATLVKKVVGKDSKANLTPHAAWGNSQTINRLGCQK